MRIAQLTPYYAPDAGGISAYVHGLAQGLRRQGEEVTVLTGSGAPGESGTRLPPRRQAFIRAAGESLGRLRPDAVHAHAHWYALVPALRYRATHRGSRVVFTFHTDPPRPYGSVRKRIFARWLNRCDLVTFPSEYLRARVERFMPLRAPTAVVYGGVRPRTVAASEQRQFRVRHALSDAEPLLAMVTLLVWRQKVEGLLRLMKALRRVGRTHPRARLVVVGEGEFRDLVEREALALRLGDRVRLVGHQKDPAVAVAASDLYTHISLQEGLPLALLEAMALGKPIVASSSGGIPEVIEDGRNGLLVPPEPDAIAAAIEGLVADPALQASLGAAARRTVVERFAWERAVSLFLRAYGGGAA